MHWLKLVHIGSAALSLIGFVIRGLWMIQGSARLSAKAVRIAPHIIDTILLGSAIWLAIALQLAPLQHAWLAAKIIALLVYIGLGLVAFRFGKTRNTRIIAWLLAILVFVWIVITAINKDPGWLI